MKYGAIILWVILLSPPPLPAQRANTPSANDAQLGRRLFQQHCAICHTQPTLTNPVYGPSLYRDIVNGKEDVVRDLIARGSPRMPGFRYGLAASEISAIVDYLKTVPKPSQSSPPTKGETRSD